jgi:hypothetical protein
MTAGSMTEHDWPAITNHLNDNGWAPIRGLIPREKCDAIAGAYDRDASCRMRSRTCDPNCTGVWSRLRMPGTNNWAAPCATHQSTRTSC